LSVTVKRPDTWPHEDRFSTIHWESEGYYNYCPRDIMLVIGDQIIETPNVIRSRAQESFSYRAMMVDYLKSGAKWYSISPNLVVVDQDQTVLIKLLEKQGIDVIRLKLRHSKMPGGGFHCITLDIRRTGTLQQYFD
jgi:N-dimethylarginine dimethylaminohydrolase